MTNLQFTIFSYFFRVCSLFLVLALVWFYWKAKKADLLLGSLLKTSNLKV